MLLPDDVENRPASSPVAPKSTKRKNPKTYEMKRATVLLVHRDLAVFSSALQPCALAPASQLLHTRRRRYESAGHKAGRRQAGHAPYHGTEHRAATREKACFLPSKRSGTSRQGHGEERPLLSKPGRKTRQGGRARSALMLSMYLRAGRSPHPYPVRVTPASN